MCLLRALALLVSLSLSARVARADPGSIPRVLPLEEPVQFVSPPRKLPPRIALREEHLALDFTVLRDSAKNRGWLMGGLLVLSATALGFGIAYPRQLGAFLLPIGALGLVRGTLVLTLQRDPRVAAETYLRLPAASAEQVRARIHFGERALAEQAHADRRARIIDGSLSLVVASSYVPVAWAVSRHHDPHYRFGQNGFDYALLTLSVINFAGALVGALSESAVEQRYQDYQALVARQEEQAPGELEKLTDSISLSLSGARDGLRLGAQASF